MLSLLPILLTLGLFPLAGNALRPALALRAPDPTRLRLLQASVSAGYRLQRAVWLRAAVGCFGFGLLVVLASPLLRGLELAEALGFAAAMSLALVLGVSLAYLSAGLLQRSAGLGADLATTSTGSALLMGSRIGGGVLLLAEAGALLTALGAQLLAQATATQAGALVWAGLVIGAVLLLGFHQLSCVPMLAAVEAGRLQPRLNPGRVRFPERQEHPTLLLSLIAPTLAGGVTRVLETYATSLTLLGMASFGLHVTTGITLASALGLPLVLRLASLVGSGVLLGGVRYDGSAAADEILRVGALADVALSLLAAAGSTRWLLGPTHWLPAFAAAACGILAQLALTWIALRQVEGLNDWDATPDATAPLGRGSAIIDEICIGLSLTCSVLAAAWALSSTGSRPALLVLAVVGLFAGAPQAGGAGIGASLASSARRLLSASQPNGSSTRPDSADPLPLQRFARLGRARHQWLSLATGLSCLGLMPVGGDSSAPPTSWTATWLLGAVLLIVSIPLRRVPLRLLHGAFAWTTQELSTHLGSPPQQSSTSPFGGEFRPRYMHYVDQVIALMPHKSGLVLLALTAGPAGLLSALNRWSPTSVSVSSALLIAALIALLGTVGARYADTADLSTSSRRPVQDAAARGERLVSEAATYLETHCISTSFSLTTKAALASILLFLAVAAQSV